MRNLKTPKLALIKKLIFLLSLHLFTFSAYTEPIPSPLLWKAEKRGKVIHIFGTIHLGVSLSDLPKEFLGYIDNSTELLLEPNPNELKEKELIKMTTLPDGQSLDELLSQESWEIFLESYGQLFIKEIRKNNTPWWASTTMSVMEFVSESFYEDFTKSFSQFLVEDTLKYQKPWAVLTSIEMFLSDSNGMLDSEIEDYAKGKGLNINDLEDYSTVFSALDKAITIDDLEKALLNLDQMPEYLSELHNCYILSDIPCLEELISEGATPQQYEILLSQRNRAWIPVILEHLEKSDSLFVAGGAGHFIGRDNVLSLLEEEGFSVERVQF